MRLTNDFHNSSATIRATAGDTISRARVMRVRRTLCGVHGCRCGDDLGRRGRQPDNGGLDFEPAREWGEYRVVEATLF